MDCYLQNLYDTLELCNMVLLRKELFPSEHIVRVQQLKKETELYIKKRIEILKIGKVSY